MKTIFNDIFNRLLAEVPELKWIDLDKGQMRIERPPILFPAALIKIQIPRSDNLNETRQLVDAQITVKLCFDYTGETSAITPEAARLTSFEYYDMVDTVWAKLQGWRTAEINSLKRTGQFDEERPDAYKQTNIVFTTSYHETI